MNQNLRITLIAVFTCSVGIAAGYGIHAQMSSPLRNAIVPAEAEIRPQLRLLDGSSRASKVLLGTLQSTEYSDDAKTRLYFNDAPVPGSEKLSEHVSIFAVIDWGDQAAFVISTSCGGSACGLNSYYILSVGKTTAPLLIEIPELFGNLDQTSLSLVNRSLVLDFGFRKKMRTVAEFDGKAVKIHSTKLEGAKLPEEDCRWLFDVALNNCLEPNPSCAETPWSGVASRGYSFLKQHQPGINASEFEKLCKSVCASRQGVGYPLFKNMVCHQ